MKVCDTCNKETENRQHVGGNGGWGASYWICNECYDRYLELKEEDRDQKLREAIEAERLEKR